MSRDLFRPTGKIYRGNLHGHCTHSDGRNEGAMLHVTCSRVDRIVVAAGGHRSFATSGDGMTEARIEISRTDFEFFRVVLTDKAGKQAWSNHYWMDDLDLR